MIRRCADTRCSRTGQGHHPFCEFHWRILPEPIRQRFRGLFEDHRQIMARKDAIDEMFLEATFDALDTLDRIEKGRAAS
jgi:hypothetical protein